MRIPGALIRLAVAAVVVVLPIQAAGASPVDDALCNPNAFPHLRSDPAVGSSWRAYRVHVPEGGQAWGSITYGTVNTQVTSRQIRWLAPDGAKSGFGHGSANNHRTHLHVEGTTLRAGTANAGCTGLLALSAEGYTLPEGDYTVVLTAAERGTVAGAFHVFGTTGTTVVATTTGPAHMYDLADIAAPDDTWTVVKPLGIDESDVTSASLDHHADHDLFLHMVAFESTSVIGYDAPDGSHDGESWYLNLDSAAGDHTFRVDSAVGDSGIFVAVADVVLP